MNKINPARGIRWIGARRSGYTSDLDDNLAASGAPSASKSKVKLRLLTKAERERERERFVRE